jgi:uncharacterized membrane protein YeiH
LNVPIALMRVGSLYAVAAIVGATSIVVLDRAGVDVTISAVVGVVLTFVVRILAVLFHWTLPEQRAISRWRPRRKITDEAPDA